MSTDASSSTNATNKAETAVAYAALILADEGLSITPEKLQDLLNAANIEDVEPIWTTLFAKALQGKDVNDILTALTTSTAEVGRPALPVDGEEDGKPDEGESKDGGDDDGEDGSDLEGGMFDLFG